MQFNLAILLWTFERKLNFSQLIYLHCIFVFDPYSLVTVSGTQEERGLGMLIRFNVFQDVNIKTVLIAWLPVPNCLTSLPRVCVSSCFLCVRAVFRVLVSTIMLIILIKKWLWFCPILPKGLKSLIIVSTWLKTNNLGVWEVEISFTKKICTFLFDWHFTHNVHHRVVFVFLGFFTWRATIA